MTERLILEVDAAGVATATSSANRAIAGLEASFVRAGQTAEQRLLAKIATLQQRMSGDPLRLQELDRLQQKVLSRTSQKLEEAGSIGRRIGDAIRNPLQAAGSAAEGFAAKLGMLGAISLGAAAGLSIAAKAAFSLVSEMGKAAEQTVNLSERLGVTAQQADRLSAMSTIAGVNVGSFETGMRQLSMALSEGGEAGKKGRESLRALGITATDSRGELRPMYDLIREIGTGIGAIQNPAERTRRAIDLFGRGALELLPLFRNWNQLQRDVGAGMEEHLVRNLARADDEIDKFRRSWQVLKAEMAGKIVAVIEFVRKLGPGADIQQSQARTILGRGAAVDQSRAQREAESGISVPGGLFPTDTARRNVQELEARSVKSGTKLIEDFRARLARTDESMKSRLQEIKKLRDEAEAKLAPGLQADVARQRIADVERLTGEERKLEAAIKARAEAERKADAHRKLAAKGLEEIRRIQSGAPREVKLAEEIARAEERRSDFQAKAYQKRIALEREVGQLELDNIRTRLETDDRGLDHRRDAELRQLEFVTARTVEQKTVLEQRKAEIEERYLLESFARKASMLDREQAVELAGIEDVARRSAIIQQFAERGRLLTMDTEAEVSKIRDTAAIRSADLLRQEYERAFDNLKRGFEGLFDAAFSGARSFADALRRMFLTVFLTPIKEELSNLFAGLFARGGTSQARGGLGALSSLLGMGGFGFPGAPGGTPGFAGPVNQGMLGRIPLIGGLFGGVPAAAAPIRQFGGVNQLALQPGAPANVGMGSPGGMFARSGFGTSAAGSTASGALFMGGAMLGAKGLQRGGLSGLGMSTAGGAMIGFSVGGPLGAGIGAAIGAGAGLIRMLFGGAEDKIVEKVRAAYNLRISKQFARDPLLPMIRQQFGGNIDVGIRSPAIRELIELYAMSTGQKAGGIMDRPRNIEMFQSGGRIFESPSFLGGERLPNLTRSGGAAQQPAGGSTTIVNLTMPADAVNDAFNGRTQTFISRNVRTVQTAANRALRQNVGRQELAALLMSPTTVTS